MSLWHAIEGAAKYAAAVATGDIASPTEQARRAAICGACLSLRMYKVPGISGESRAWFCGQAFVDNLAQRTPTCGCLVGHGSEREKRVELTAAGKACVGSERCPQAKW